jgi:putative transposase
VSTRRNYNTPCHAHELTFSCYKGYPFLEADRTRQWLADAVNAACEKHRFRLWAYVMMPEHAHLLVWPQETDYDIARFRSAVKEPVGRKAIKYMKDHSPSWLAKVTRQRRGRTERLFWQPGGGYDRNIHNPKTIRPVIDYIHLNPVRRGLFKMPEDWAWSSARWYREGEAGPCVVHPLTDEIG